MKLNFKEILAIFVIIFLFVLVSYLSKEYSSYLEEVVGQSGQAFGMFIYFILAVLAVVVAPVSTLPLLPIAVSMWGEIVTIVLSISSWTIGAMIAFIIAQKWGKPVVKKFINLEKVSELENILGARNLFGTVVILRMVIPVDVLSYALGLFVKMPISHYFLATFLGVIPFTIIFTYTAGMPIVYQIVTLFIAMIFATFGFHYIKKVRSKNNFK